MEWYPENKEELDSMLDSFLEFVKKVREVHGLIVPHAGYQFSGRVAGRVYSLLEKDSGIRKVILIGPSHYSYLRGIVSSDKQEWETPLGKIKLISNGFKKENIHREHSIGNQIPFLQKLGIKLVLPLMVGDVSNEEAEEIAKGLVKLADNKTIFVFSTDLSHFLNYDKALIRDRKTIEIIENLDFENFDEIDACGRNGLLILFYLCKLKSWKPKLVEYKNSGDVAGDKASVVGYAGFVF